MNRATLKTGLENYQSDFIEETAFAERFLTLLREEQCYLRASLHGHLTASAWIVNQERNAALMLHHKKLDRWLQPGGHADGDENLIAVARKEAEEETGLQQLLLPSEAIFDLDIHTIPERKGIPAHDHYDVRFLFVADEREPITHNHESNALQWIPLDQLEQYVGNEKSILRMREKVLQK